MLKEPIEQQKKRQRKLLSSFLDTLKEINERLDNYDVEVIPETIQAMKSAKVKRE
jgi:hypothetical protein